MNPDIQRIAERLASKFCGVETIYSTLRSEIERELGEYAALRDTQERVEYQAACSGLWYTDPKAAGAIRAIKIGPTTYYLHDAEEIDKLETEISELKEKWMQKFYELRAELARRDEQLQQMIEGKTHDDAQHAKVIAEISERQVEELRSLRRELARRDEVEKVLREKLEEEGKYRMEDQAFMVKIQEDARVEKNALRSRIGELESLVDKLVKE